MRILTAFLPATFFVVAACGGSSNGTVASPTPESVTTEAEVRKFIANADRVTVYSITPRVFAKGKGLTLDATAKGVHGVYGSVELKPDEFESLAGHLRSALDPGGAQAMCYLPRHAITAKKGNTSCFIEICFECSYIYWTLSGRNRTLGDPLGKDAEELRKFLDSKLKAAGVTLSAEVDDKPKAD